VITAVCIFSKEKCEEFYASTEVHFSEIADEEIEYYINKYKPFDKAGSYGVQEWIGYIGIEKIVGSYFNVMGLPVKRLYDELKTFIETL
jgi:septum formation protein